MHLKEVTHSTLRPNACVIAALTKRRRGLQAEPETPVKLPRSLVITSRVQFWEKSHRS
jgi:hypothetical protein